MGCDIPTVRDGLIVKRVLVVEDNPLNMALTVQLLEDDHEVLQATDGEMGLEMARHHRPDIILMDLSLPKVDGWNAVRQLRADRRTRAIPIIALSAHAAQREIEQALAAGCDAYVTKPIDEAALLDEVARLLAGPARKP